MRKIDKIIAACDKLKSPFMVRDVMAIARIGDDGRTSRLVSAELYRLAQRGALVKSGKDCGRNLYSTLEDKTTAEAFALFFSEPKERGTESKSFLLEHPIIPFPLGGVRMKAAEQRFFAA